MASRFRLLYPWMLPGWLFSGDGGKVVHAIATIIDAVTQRSSQGRDQRFPSRASESAIAEMSYDRGLVRGRSETLAAFANRLRAWRYPRGHRVRGSAFALLDQIATYLGGEVTSWTIDASGNRHDRAIDGTESYSYGNAWTWDSEPASEWGRFWIVLHSWALGTHPGYGTPELWGGSLDASEYALGINHMTQWDADALRGLMRGRHPWRPAGTTGQWLIVSLDGVWPTPDATWERWGKLVGTDYVPSRRAECGYIYLAATREQYPGDPSVFASTITPVVGGTELGPYEGDPASFPATITLPDGSSYAGDPSSFPTIALVDDGD